MARGYRRASASTRRVAAFDDEFHVLRDAGHWLHVDNPEGLRDVLAPELARLEALESARKAREG